MRSLGLFLCAALFVAPVGCGDENAAEDDDGTTSGTGGAGGTPQPDTSIALLGAGTHDVTKVNLVEVGRQADGLNVPRDLAFNPAVPTELWVVNIADDSVVVFSNTGLPNQTAQKFIAAPGSNHFLANPAALAFGASGSFATIHDEDQPTQGEQTPDDFMGPTLWTSNLALFDGGDTGHIDMLHNSPLGVGIAWQRDNVYWVFDGYHSAITRYDFQQPHVQGGVDHSDGIITRYVEGQVKRVPGLAAQSTPSHMDFRAGTSQLYIADSGNGRIGMLDTAQGVPSGTIGPNYDGCTMNRVDGLTVQTVIDGMIESRMPFPSGLAIHNVLVGGEPRDVIFVSDISTSTIYAWSFEGELLDWLPLGMAAGALSGITFDANGSLWLVDGLAHRVLRIEPADPQP